MGNYHQRLAAVGNPAQEPVEDTVQVERKKNSALFVDNMLPKKAVGLIQIRDENPLFQIATSKEALACCTF